MEKNSKAIAALNDPPSVPPQQQEGILTRHNNWMHYDIDIAAVINTELIKNCIRIIPFWNACDVETCTNQMKRQQIEKHMNTETKTKFNTMEHRRGTYAIFVLNHLCACKYIIFNDDQQTTLLQSPTNHLYRMKVKSF